jgi:hypothetical protein
MDTSASNPPMSPADRRNAKRLRALRSAKLIYGVFGSTIIDCLLIEMSETGARVETAVMTQVPEVLSLRLSDNTERQVRQRWASGNEIGLEFIPPPP